MDLSEEPRTAPAPVPAAPRPVVDMGEFAPYAMDLRVTRVEPTDDKLEVVWSDAFASRFHLVWLRDHCACPECRHPQTRERLFRVLDLPEVLPRPATRVTPSGALQIDWPAMGNHAPHTSLFDPGWLRARVYDRRQARSTRERVEIWDLAMAERVPTFTHASIMGTDAGLRDWLGALERYGLALMVDGPAGEGEVIRIAERVGSPRETNFGRHFDVVSKPEPNNAAYTALPLEPHVDLPNWQRPPDFQLLYCLENSAFGGESRFTDGFAVAARLREEDPEAFEALSSLPVDFRFQDENSDIRFRAPVISLNADGRVHAVRFNNWIRDTLALPEERVVPFYRAYRRLWSWLRDPRFMIRLSLEPGQMLAFDNLRVLHGREAFDPASGRRHLQGTYLDRDMVMSALRIRERNSAGDSA